MSILLTRFIQVLVLKFKGIMLYMCTGLICACNFQLQHVQAMVGLKGVNNFLQIRKFLQIWTPQSMVWGHGMVKCTYQIYISLNPH